MKISRTIILIAFCAFAAPSVLAQNTAFTYQGSLNTSGQPANGNYDMQFTLHASDVGNSGVGATITRSNVAVVNGYFAVSLDWGTSVYPVFGSRWIEIAVRQAGAGAYTTLNPRDLIKAAPYAISSFYAETSRLADFVGGRPASDFALTTDPRLSDARTPTANSPFYIQNGSTAQSGVNFNISGDGTVGGVFSANQFNIGANRLIKTDQWNTLTVGIESGDVSTTGSAFNNSFFGFRAGKVNQGFANSFFGAYAGERTNGGVQNSFFGAGAGFSNVNGDDNTLVGFDAGRNDLDLTPTGSRNTIMGSGAGNRTVGNDNTFVGFRAGRADDAGTGSSNTLVGAGSFNFRGGGNSNTFIGANAGTFLTLQNATAIGAGALVSTSNTVALGREFGPDLVLVPGRLQVQRGFFRVDNNNNQKVSIGGNDSNYTFDVRANSNFAFRVATPLTGGNVASFGGNGRFEVDSTTVAGGRLIILENGNVGIGTTDPQSSLQVNGSEILSTGANAGFKFRNRNSTNANEDWVWYASGNIARLFSPTGGGDLVTVKTTGVMTIAGLGLAGFTQLCRNASNEISTCSSSIRYKDNVQNYRPGLDLIKKLRPVSFNWKADGKEDLGLVAEEVAAAEPLLASRNDKGEVEGVKYDRVAVVLVNAVKEQQTQIEAQRKQIEQQQAEIEKQRAEIEQQKKRLDALTEYLCSKQADPAICGTP